MGGRDTIQRTIRSDDMWTMMSATKVSRENTLALSSPSSLCTTFKTTFIYVAALITNQVLVAACGT